MRKVRRTWSKQVSYELERSWEMHRLQILSGAVPWETLPAYAAQGELIVPSQVPLAPLFTNQGLALFSSASPLREKELPGINLLPTSSLSFSRRELALCEEQVARDEVIRALPAFYLQTQGIRNNFDPPYIVTLRKLRLRPNLCLKPLRRNLDFWKSNI